MVVFALVFSAMMAHVTIHRHVPPVPAIFLIYAAMSIKIAYEYQQKLMRIRQTRRFVPMVLSVPTAKIAATTPKEKETKKSPRKDEFGPIPPV